jgi:hypothetical protein
VRRAALLLLTLLVLLLPAPAQAQSDPACQVAAEAARDALPAIYSWGGEHPDDPINPLTGTYWPRTGPDSFDCSGLIYWAYQQAGMTVPGTTYEQRWEGDYIDCTLDDLNGAATTCWAPGDLAFASSTSPWGEHVSMYIGGGMFADCYNHDVDCIIHDISTDSYYQNHFWHARRYVSGCESLTVDPGTPDPFDPSEPRTLEEIPGIVAPVQLVAPYSCADECNTAEHVLQPLAETDLLALRQQHWYDVGLHIEWLAVALWNRVSLPVICWLLVVLQTLLNAYSTMLNVWGAAINDFWRLWVTWMLWTGEAYIAAWLLVEDLRDLLWQMVAHLAQFDVYWRATLDALQHIITLLASMTTSYVEMLYTPIAAMRYLVALLVTSVPGITLVIDDPESYKPAALAGIDSNMFWQMFVGGVNGFFDAAGWWAALFVTFYYVVFIWRGLDEARNL